MERKQSNNEEEEEKPMELDEEEKPMELDEELYAGNDVVDEFSEILNKERSPEILITTSSNNSTREAAIISNLIHVIPNAHYFKRGKNELKKIVKYAIEKEFTSMIVVRTTRHEQDALLIVGLPDGPTAHFMLTKFHLLKDIKKIGKPTSRKPELVLTNFTTRLEHRVGRMIQSLFPHVPKFGGSSHLVVSFHNRRDVIVLRRHRYIFETKEGKQTGSEGRKSKDVKTPHERTIARLQECGPQFTLKLISLQRGILYTSAGEYEWVYKPEMDTSRRMGGQVWDLPEFQGLRI